MKLINKKSITDPSLNLAIEEYALRHMDPTHSYLLLYVNDPSVIIGRNQNIYEEVNLKLIKRHNIPVYRRISGGGAVYHDHGNLNFSFITDYNTRRLNNYTEFNQPIINALKNLGIEAYMDDRNAIRVGDHKISGNAQFSSSGRMFSHGTLLFDSDLWLLKKSLKPELLNIRSRAHKSVRSDIVNIRTLLDRNMGIQDFREYLIDYVNKSNTTDLSPVALSDEAWDKIYQLKSDRYEKWEWNVGKSPRFTIQQRLNLSEGYIDLDLEVRKGYVHWVQLESDTVNAPLLHTMEQHLSNTRFVPEDLRTSLESVPTLSKNDQLTNYLIDQLFQLTNPNTIN